MIVKQGKAIEDYMVIREKLSKNNSEKTPDYYAGSYFDTEGNLVFNLVNNDGGEIKGLFQKNNLDLTNIRFKKVNYSLTYLEKIIEKLNKNMLELAVTAIELDEENNKINVYVDSLSDVKTNTIRKVFSTPAIEFKKQESSVVPTTDVINGTSASDPYSSFTIGFAAKNNSSGKVGFVLPGHIPASIGQSITYGGSEIGKLTTKVLGGSTDASWVARTEPLIGGPKWKAVKTFMNGNSWSSFVSAGYTYPQNATVYAYTAGSGRTSGVILSSNFSVISGGIQFTNMCKANYKAILGDSGAAVCIPNSAYPNDFSLMSIVGTQSSSYLPNGQWVNGTSYTVFSKLYNVMSSLNVTPYSD
jgi:hypothetical protein